MNKKKIKKIKLIFVDFDGTLTNNLVYLDENGLESVSCNRSDGLAISNFKKINIHIICVSTEKNKIVKEKCKKLNIESFLGIDNKKNIIVTKCKELKIDLKNTAFIGNGLNDLSAMNLVGLPIAVKDSNSLVKKTCNIILNTKGGEGVLEEFFEIYTKCNNSFLF